MSKGINLLICGSQRFEDRSFFCATMDAWAHAFKSIGVPINKIVAGKTNGAAKFAQEWAAEMGIQFVSKNLLAEDRADVYYDNDRYLPQAVISQDPGFRQGMEELKELAINSAILFPNPEDTLGAATYNIQKMLGLISKDIEIFDASKAILTFKAKSQAIVSNSGTIDEHGQEHGQEHGHDKNEEAPKHKTKLSGMKNL